MSIETVTVTKSGLDALREERNELSRDYRKLSSEADELRRQRDEALPALRSMLHMFDRGLPKASIGRKKCDAARRILAQYEKDGEV